MATLDRTIDVSLFKKKCLKLVGDGARGGTEIVITKYAWPISRLVTLREQPKSPFAIDKERIEILGDIISPVNVVWEAQIGRTEHGD